MGLEPIRHVTYAPQTYLSAYSSTSAYLLFNSKKNCIITEVECQVFFIKFFNKFFINVLKTVNVVVYLNEIMC